MSAFALLLKSYRPDAAYVDRLLGTYERHNVEGIPLHLVVPRDDVDAFRPLLRPGVTLHTEDIVESHLVNEPVAGFSAGYINQEIVKLAFWETGLADAYLCIDSELEFVRDFRRSDFMADEDTPFTFLTEDAVLHAEPEYYATHWPTRAAKLRLIMDAVGLDSPRMLTVHGHAVFSAVVLRAFRDRFLQPRGWDYADALAVAPYEPSWYSFWLQADRTIPIVMREPIVKTFHDPTQYLDYSIRGITAQEAALGYVAIIVNSNYSRGEGLLSLGEDQSADVARYVPASEITRALVRRPWAAIRGRNR